LANEFSSGSFDSICMFQVLEHMDRIGNIVEALGHLLADDGDVFVSVPNPERIEVQERSTGFWDMPPNHIGRWTREALDAATEGVGLRVVEHELESESRNRALWTLAKYRFRARGYDSRTVAGRADGIPNRVLRGAVKRPLTALDALAVAIQLRGTDIPAATQWFHLPRLIRSGG
jgi:hypothetical protein